MDNTEQLRVVISAEGTEFFKGGVKLSGDEVRKLGDELTTTGKKLEFTTGAAKDTGKAMADTAGKAEQLGQVAGQVARGDMAGLATSALRVGSSVGVLAGVFAVAGAAAVGLGAAYVQGARETDALNKSLVLTGNFAGMAGADFDIMSQRIAQSANEGIGSARETMIGMVASGKFTQESMLAVGTAAALMAKYTGQSQADIVKQFAGMTDGVTKWSVKANESYHFLTFEQYKHIKALEEQGRVQEAVQSSMDAFNTHIKSNAKEVGLLEQAWTGAKNMASDYWDLIKSIGRPETKFAQAAAMNEELQARLKQGPRRDVMNGQAKFDARNAFLQSEIDRLVGEANAEAAAAAAQSKAAQTAAAKIKAAETAKTPGAAKAEDHSADNYIDQLTKQYRALTGDVSVYDTVLEHVTTNSEKFTDVQRKEALEKARLIDVTRQKLQVDAAEMHYLTEMTAAREKYTSVWLDQEAVARRDTQDREFEISLLGKTTEQIARLTMARNVERQAQERRLAVMNAYSGSGADGSGSTISADEMNAQLAQIDADAQRQMAQRNVLLADQFKPGWQKIVDGWGDTMNMVKTAHDNAMTSIVRNGEDAFIQWAKTGKLNAKNLVDGILDEFLRLQYRKYLASSLNSIGDSLLSMMGLGSDTTQLPTGDFARMDRLATSHTGSVVGMENVGSRLVNPAVFNGARRFHGGGLAGDEVPVIAQRGEGIFTQKQMAALAPVGAGGGQVTVNVINNAGSQVKATATKSADGKLIEVLIDQLDDAMGERVGAGVGSLNAALTGRFGLRPTMG